MEEDNKHHAQEQHPHGTKEDIPAKKSNDDELSIDFSKIKGWFSGGESGESNQGQSHASHEGKLGDVQKEDEITIDFWGIGSRLKGMFKPDASGN